MDNSAFLTGEAVLLRLLDFSQFVPLAEEDIRTIRWCVRIAFQHGGGVESGVSSGTRIARVLYLLPTLQAKCGYSRDGGAHMTLEPSAFFGFLHPDLSLQYHLTGLQLSRELRASDMQ